jgi:hypothetical protein
MKLWLDQEENRELRRRAANTRWGNREAIEDTDVSDDDDTCGSNAHALQKECLVFAVNTTTATKENNKQQAGSSSRHSKPVLLEAIRDLFPGTGIADLPLRNLDAKLQSRLGAAYDREAFVNFLRQRIARSRGKITTGLIFDFSKIPNDYCEMLEREQQRESERPQAIVPVMTEAEYQRWRVGQEEVLKDPNLGAMERKLILECLREADDARKKPPDSSASATGGLQIVARAAK